MIYKKNGLPFFLRVFVPLWQKLFFVKKSMASPLKVSYKDTKFYLLFNIRKTKKIFKFIKNKK